ncbi:MAG TPA: hypothetical protein VJZ91_18515 [Blastocatellia bacterium]|nr:hypothetical protein [Blastocatellia bacterium]
MESKTGASYEDANLILKLYEIRREEKLREARQWFASEFRPQTFDDVKAVLMPNHPNNTDFRMVVSYWDMAASFAVRGPLNAELLLESAGELIGVWALVEPFITELRQMFQLPEFLRNLEEVIQRVDWAPRRLEWIQARIAAQRAAADSPPQQ